MHKIYVLVVNKVEVVGILIVGVNCKFSLTDLLIHSSVRFVCFATVNGVSRDRVLGGLITA